MPIDVKTIQNRHATCTVELAPGATVTIEYSPVQLADFMERTEAGESELTGSDSLDSTKEALAFEFVRVASSWDVTRGEEPFPLDANEIANDFDIGFLSKCLAKLTEHYSAGKDNGEPLSKPGIATTSPRVGAQSSPVGAANRASRRSSSSQKSRSSAGSSRGRLQSITTSGIPSSPPAFRPSTAS